MRKKGNPGVITRHSRECARTKTGSECDCSPSYVPWVFDKRARKKVYGPTFSGKGALTAAKTWRSDAVPAVRQQKLRAPSRQTLEEAWEEWIAAAEAGEVLSRFKRPYKPSALRGYRADMARYVLPVLGAVRLADVT